MDNSQVRFIHHSVLQLYVRWRLAEILSNRKDT